MNALLPRSSIALFLGSALLAQAPARVPLAVEDILPAQTYAAVRFGGLAACRDASGELPLAPLVASFLQRLPPDVRAAHLDRGLDHASLMLQNRVQRLGLSPADLRAVVSRPMVLALGRLSIEGMGPSVALVIDEGDSRDAIGRCATALSALLLPTGAHPGSAAPAVAPTDVNGVAVRILHVPQGPPIFMGSIAGHFVVTNSRGYLGEMVDVVRSGAPCLAAQSRLADLRARLTQPALASVFVNTASLVSIFDAHLPYETAAFGKALGIGALDSLYAATTAGPQGGIDVLHIGVRGDEKGLLKALVAQPADLGLAEFCSPNTVVFAAGSLDAPAVVDAFGQFLALLPASVREQIRGPLLTNLGRNLRQMGTTPRAIDALLRAFGTQVSVALGLEKGAVPKPELLLRLQVRDPGAVASAMQRLEAMTADAGGVAWKTRQVGEHTIRFCNLELPGAPLQVSPCYVLGEQGLLCGSDVATLVRALRQAENRDESLAAQDDFRTLVADAQGASGVLHLRLSRAVELGWRTVESWLYPQLDAHALEIGFGSDALPDAEAVGKALGTSTFLYHVDDEGLTVKYLGSLALGAQLAAFGRLGDEVLDRACGKVF